MVISTGYAGRPNLGVAPGAGTQILTVEFIKARAGQAQFASGLAGGEFTGAMAGQQMADDRSGQTFDEL